MSKRKSNKGVRPQAANHQRHSPHWCLSDLQHDIRNDLTKQQRQRLTDALSTRAKMTWQELNFADRHGLGFEWIAASDINRTLPVGFDSSRYMAFRYDGKLPMVGHRTDRTFHLLWVSPKFGFIYDH